MLFNGLLEGFVPLRGSHYHKSGDRRSPVVGSHAHSGILTSRCTHATAHLDTVPHSAMPRENSLSDFDGESLTSDEEVRVTEAPAQGPSPQPQPRASTKSERPHLESDKKSAGSRKSSASRRAAPIPQQPINRFRGAVRKVITLNRTSAVIRRGGLGAEPGVDPRRYSAFATFGNIRQKCIIDIIDYSSLRCSTGRMTNGEFIEFLRNPHASTPEHWVKVRWINIGGISWDVISAVALKYGNTRLQDVSLSNSESFSRFASSIYRRLASSQPCTFQG